MAKDDIVFTSGGEIADTMVCSRVEGAGEIFCGLDRAIDEEGVIIQVEWITDIVDEGDILSVGMFMEFDGRCRRCVTVWCHTEDEGTDGCSEDNDDSNHEDDADNGTDSSFW